MGPGIYPFLTSGRHEVVPLLVDLVMQEIVRIHTEPVSEEELFGAKVALIDGHIPDAVRRRPRYRPDVRAGVDAIRAS